MITRLLSHAKSYLCEILQPLKKNCEANFSKKQEVRTPNLKGKRYMEFAAFAIQWVAPIADLGINVNWQRYRN